MKRIDKDIIEIQDTWYRDNCEKKRHIIVEESNGTFTLHHHDHQNVAPAFNYPTKRAIMARLSQMLSIGPVAPQIHPESVCIGNITMEDGENDQ